MKTLSHISAVACSISLSAVVGCTRTSEVLTSHDGGADSVVSDGDASTSSDARDAAPGAVVRIHVRATTAEVTHASDSVGQQPREFQSGYRSYQMLRSSGDTNPLDVFDYGTGFVEASYDDGDDTVVATVRAADLTAGHYTVGRVVMSHARLKFDATAHVTSSAIPGELDSVFVLSNGTEWEGTLRDRGWYSLEFTAFGSSFPQQGSGYPIASLSSGGFTVTEEDGDYVFYFPIDITVVPTTTEDVDIIMDVNTHECFRWQDQGTSGYAAGVFDITATTTEPVVQLGANSLLVTAEF